jgi:hypothetical protein
MVVAFRTRVGAARHDCVGEGDARSRSERYKHTPHSKDSVIAHYTDAVRLLASGCHNMDCADDIGMENAHAGHLRDECQRSAP